MNSGLRLGSIATGGLAIVLLGAGAFLASRGVNDAQFMPHAHCYLFNESLMRLHGGSDLLIGFAYLGISATLVYVVVRARRELPFHWMMLAFALFIVACGGTHFMEVWTLQAEAPRYWLSGWVKLLTAVASVVTALALPPLVPRILAVLRAARTAQEQKKEIEKAYAELDILYRKVTQLDELKTNFFANVSHDLRTPLALVSAPVERLLHDPALNPVARKELLVVRRNALILHQHVDDLLDVSKLDAGKIELQYARADLATMLRFMGGVFDSTMSDRQIHLEIHAPPHLVAEVDGDKIQRILLNLLSNALKFVPERGRIVLTLESAGDDAVLRVEDDGPGISADLHETIFERFHRGDEEMQRRFGGTGLGLSIVKEFVQLHGGTVVAGDSALGGAAFTVRIPVKAPAGRIVGASDWHSHDPLLRVMPGESAEDESRWVRAQSSASGEVAVAPSDAGRPLVLVVEDNWDMNEFICRVLAKDARTMSAANGRIALDTARRFPPDLIVTDMMMPEMSGGELVEALRADGQLKEIPVIVLTARADDELKMSLLIDGAQDYVMKPFAVDELCARVRNQLVAKVTRDTLRRELDSQTADLTQLAREVTQRARELEKARDAAEAANRAKDQFLAVLSHELRTPLTPALAAADNLESATHIDPVELRESLALIRRNIELEARLVDDLLDLTRISKGKLQIHVSTINLHETIEHAVEMCRSTANNMRSDLVLELGAADHHVRGDGARLAQIFWNLILNAVKFTPANGQIIVRTSNPEPGRVAIKVTDNGIGIDPEMLSRIFDPFQQGEVSTTRRYGGLGLGLSVAKGLVDAHGGRIDAYSDGKDYGSTFTVELGTTEPPPAPKMTTSSAAEPSERKIRVLIVEDHEDTRRVLERLLGRWGHHVKAAPTITAALEIAAEFEPELLLSDIGLPDGTGMELLGKIQHDRALLAIAMSGYGMEADLEQTKHAGFDDHLVKPVSAERLKEAIDRLLAERR